MKILVCVKQVPDPQTAIFRVSDIAVAEDLPSFIPLLSDACRRVQGHSPEAAR